MLVREKLLTILRAKISKQLTGGWLRNAATTVIGGPALCDYVRTTEVFNCSPYKDMLAVTHIFENERL